MIEFNICWLFNLISRWIYFLIKTFWSIKESRNLRSLIKNFDWLRSSEKINFQKIQNFRFIRILVDEKIFNNWNYVAFLNLIGGLIWRRWDVIEAIFLIFPNFESLVGFALTPHQIQLLVSDRFLICFLWQVGGAISKKLPAFFNSVEMFEELLLWWYDDDRPHCFTYSTLWSLRQTFFPGSIRFLIAQTRRNLSHQYLIESNWWQPE